MADPILDEAERLWAARDYSAAGRRFLDAFLIHPAAATLTRYLDTVQNTANVRERVQEVARYSRLLPADEELADIVIGGLYWAYDLYYLGEGDGPEFAAAQSIVDHGEELAASAEIPDETRAELYIRLGSVYQTRGLYDNEYRCTGLVRVLRNGG